jgi:ATP-dependent DNA helicase RecG
LCKISAYALNVGGSSQDVFVCIGSSTRKADAATIERMRLQSLGRTWDGLPVAEATMDLLDVGLIQEFWSERYQARGIPIPKSGEKDWLLKNRFAYSESNRLAPTNAGILFFHPRPQEILPQAKVEMARFDRASARNFLDKQSLDGPLWKLPELALQFMKKHIPLRAVRGRLQRSEGLAYPEAAFRELFLSALCHRAYEGSSGSVRVALFDDVVEITNPGSLPDGLQLNDLGTGISMLRNPVLARGFSEIGLIEGWGTGIHVAQEALRHASLPPAEFNLKGFFTQVSSNWRWATNLPEGEQKTLTLAVTMGAITTGEVATLLNTSERSARRILQTLVTKKYLLKSGTTKAAAYRLQGAGRID